MSRLRKLLKPNKGKLIIFSLLFIMSILSSFVFYDAGIYYPQPWWADIALTIKHIPGLWIIAVIHWIIAWPVYAILYPLRYVLSDLYIKIGWVIELTTSILYYVYLYVLSSLIVLLKERSKPKTKIVELYTILKLMKIIISTLINVIRKHLFLFSLFLSLITLFGSSLWNLTNIELFGFLGNLNAIQAYNSLAKFKLVSLWAFVLATNSFFWYVFLRNMSKLKPRSIVLVIFSFIIIGFAYGVLVVLLKMQNWMGVYLTIGDYLRDSHDINIYHMDWGGWLETEYLYFFPIILASISKVVLRFQAKN